MCGERRRFAMVDAAMETTASQSPVSSGNAPGYPGRTENLPEDREQRSEDMGAHSETSQPESRSVVVGNTEAGDCATCEETNSVCLQCSQAFENSCTENERGELIQDLNGFQEECFEQTGTTECVTTNPEVGEDTPETGSDSCFPESSAAGGRKSERRVSFCITVDVYYPRPDHYPLRPVEYSPTPPEGKVLVPALKGTTVPPQSALKADSATSASRRKPLDSGVKRAATVPGGRRAAMVSTPNRTAFKKENIATALKGNFHKSRTF